MKKFYIKPLVAAIALTAAGQGYAQEASAENTLEEVVVTGFRGSLQSSLNTKRDSVGVVDAIYAEDIADFPDNNLAESLQRIPGVAISRAGGEGQQITVRGLGPDYTRIRINGMESMSSTGGTDAIGGNNRGRGFDFNTFSSDLFSNLIVSKTNSAEIEEGSLGATVDLKTARPMELDDFVLSVGGNLNYNDKSEKVDPKIAVMVSKQFSDTFGALLSVSYADRNITDEGNSTVRWATYPDVGSYRGITDPTLSPELARLEETEEDRRLFHPRIPRYDSYTHEITRTGVAATFQWLPTDATDIVLDVLYSKHDATRNEIFMQGIGNSTADYDDYNFTDYEIDGQTIVYAAISNANAQVENRFTFWRY